ncbi:putative coactivator CBP, KIX domain superfamily, mediator complex subunit 15, KIX [Helianthus annuus]|nr:putative coactivator CBP, KIX domain superfamily, mediator complex subunit 15, KIX [Helianthus annuus]KAJ0803512.1 putative coactivator CBP, KIX domain superfamily, mediator complex subunit 15, KIX [Helianthus annuus]KAJ0803884.1 putative coactivator CBP, KIX domain superfamily, mediator complex subunit 15, KIX [Helianthus annuus]
MEQAVSFEKSNYIAATSQGATERVDDPILESGDWRAQLEADSRQIFVNKITETLKRCLPFAGDKELQDIAVWFEEKTYTVATSQSNYLRELSVKMLAIDPMQSKSDANSVNPWVLDLIQDWKEEVYQKVLYAILHFFFKVVKAPHISICIWLTKFINITLNQSLLLFSHASFNMKYRSNVKSVYKFVPLLLFQLNSIKQL